MSTFFRFLLLLLMTIIIIIIDRDMDTVQALFAVHTARTSAADLM